MEAECTAACDAGKLILFFRSLLQDLGMEQQHAIILYEDNNGALITLYTVTLCRYG